MMHELALLIPMLSFDLQERYFQLHFCFVSFLFCLDATSDTFGRTSPYEVCHLWNYHTRPIINNMVQFLCFVSLVEALAICTYMYINVNFGLIAYLPYVNTKYVPFSTLQ